MAELKAEYQGFIAWYSLTTHHKRNKEDQTVSQWSHRVSQLNHTDSHAKIQSNEVLELANMKQQRGVRNDIIRRINEAIQ